MGIDSTTGTVAEVEELYERPLAELFAIQVREHPDRPAVAGPEAQLSYAELDSLAEQFARGLREFGVLPGAVLGVAGQRGVDACVALLGAASAEASYLPLDASLPAERLRTMLADSGATAVVRLPGSAELLAPGARVLDFDEVLAGGDLADPLPLPDPATPAYVMFTSGTTGRPKAVAVPQRGVARLSVANGFLEIRPDDRVLHAATLSFDASVLEIWPTLLNGACLVPAAAEVLLSPPALAEFIRRERISVLFLTTSVFHLMARERPEMFAGLRYVVTGGEALQPEAARRVLELGRPEHLVNAYGPTEAACVAAAHEITDLAEDATAVPIGRPIADTRCHVLRADGTPAAVGEEGELCIGGAGVAAGYLNAPELAATRFVHLPLAPDGASERVYRTGDYVRRRPDGVLEFCGRRDEQVKVRGFRVEPGEIRTALLRHPAVADAAVLAREDGVSRYLAAYAAIPDGPEPAPSGAELRAFLREVLPSYAVPATLTVLERLPLTPSGKLDREALPDPAAAPAPVIPGDPDSTAARVATAWAALLPTGQAEPTDDFFESGGNSLLAVQLVAKVQTELEIDDQHNDLLVTELLNEPTLRAFTRVVERVAQGDADRAPGAAPVNRWRPDTRWAVPTVTSAQPHPRWRAPRHVLLTGATGFLGAYLLRELLDRTEAQIHTLVRAEDTAHARERLAQAQQRYGSGRPLPADRVRPLLGDLAKPRLGLSDRDWAEQAASADVVHHCGAEVNFLYPYEKLRVANVHGTQEVLRLAAGRAVPVHHVSTLAVVHGMGAAGLRLVTEDTPLDHVEQLAMGYPESKWVAEEVVRGAARAGLPVAVHRPYEVSGNTENFTWNSNAALCELFRLIAEMGLAPDLDLALNLLPVDYVAAAIVHLSLHTPAEGQTYHLVNPHEAVLGDLVDRLRAHGHRIETVGYPEWIEAMLGYLADRPSHPFTPLTQLFTKRIPPSGITVQELAAVSVSPVIDRARVDRDLADSGIHCPPVDRTLLDHYIGYFHASGFIPAPTTATTTAGARRD
ncbi:amino acid adenylation domain-containing protein [Kitasatospora azatica]|uniref:amino acid adenylation domain-containing protein n=1 Tax=Kitasatospora azatica TaxID=58347 RepID=UPI0006892AA1|nr:amino acid adenylation domain-containing protein [Kitasatospora azatica]